MTDLGMPQRSSKKKPNDVNSLAASIVAEATDERPKAEPTPEEIAHEAAVAHESRGVSWYVKVSMTNGDPRRLVVHSFHPSKR